MSLEPIVPPPSGDDLNPALFERYCLGQETTQELTAIEMWFQQHPGQQAWYEALRSKLRTGTFSGVSPTDHARGVEVILRHARGDQSSDRGAANSSRGFSIPEVFLRGTLRQIVHTMFDGLTSRAVVALFGRKVTTLTRAEIERLWRLVEQSDTDDE